MQFRPAWIAMGPCRKILGRDGRDLLLCEGADSHQGLADTYLSVLDFTSKPHNNQIPIFFGLDDSGCTPLGDLPPHTVLSGSIQAVDLSSNVITVKAKLGRAVFTDAQLQACGELVGKGQHIAFARSGCTRYSEPVVSIKRLNPWRPTRLTRLRAQVGRCHPNNSTAAASFVTARPSSPEWFSQTPNVRL